MKLVLNQQDEILNRVRTATNRLGRLAEYQVGGLPTQINQGPVPTTSEPGRPGPIQFQIRHNNELIMGAVQELEAHILWLEQQFEMPEDPSQASTYGRSS